MALRRYIPDALDSVFGNTLIVSIGLVIAAVFSIDTAWILDLPDLGVPWRQLMQHRNLQGLVLSLRISGSYVASCATAGVQGRVAPNATARSVAATARYGLITDGSW